MTMQYDGRRYVIGIDLGTTNSAVSYVDLEASPKKGSRRIHLFNIPQLVGPGEFKGNPVLPSFLYIPGEYDVSKSAVSIPWEREVNYFTGMFARDHGAKVPARLVSSAKSWLCHGDVDRRARILPWGSGGEVDKVSPVEATSAYLRHIRNAWNSRCGEDEERYLENQLIIITVPASFDEVARDLTIEAARQAGLSSVTLIEEPLAAFYSWLNQHETAWHRHVQPNELILICDVGGGTTDFTLIYLREVDGSPRFERIAVGDHLILGGDNIDLALAHLVEKSAGRKQFSLNQDRWKALCHQCRQAKEKILDKQSEKERITIMGEGSSLIAGTLSATLNREDLEQTVVEGFFPLVAPRSVNAQPVRKGITEFGLPYEQEPAITRHLGQFLDRHAETVRELLNRQPMPDYILFNGGSLKAGVIQERIREAIRFWFDRTDSDLPKVLENPEPDLSVAIGASYYGLVKTGIGVKVGSGSPRSYYLGITTGEQTDNWQAICLVERGLDEGSHIELTDKKFEVLINQPVTFDVYSSSFRSGDRKGDIVSIDETFTKLPPIQTVIQFGKKGIRTALPVVMEADYTEIGTLALFCSSQVSRHRWQLQFQLRDTKMPLAVEDKEVFDTDLTETVRRHVWEAFLKKKDKSAIESLAKTITRLVDRPKEAWPLSLIRAIADELIKNRSLRKTSPVHEHRWLNLVGFTMRPGFGDGFDEQRIRALWKIYNKGKIFLKNQQVATEWWILWRRVAAGLKPGQQRQFLQDITPVVFPRKNAKVKISPQQLVEVWMAVANLEKLLVKDKIKLGRQLIAEIRSRNQKPQPQLFWALSRIGARVMLYGSSDRVIPPEEVQSWIDNLLKIQKEQPYAVGSALVQLARKTGDRARDVEDHYANRIQERLGEYSQFEDQARLLQKAVPIEKSEQSTIFGESLPAGLTLTEG